MLEHYSIIILTSVVSENSAGKGLPPRIEILAQSSLVRWEGCIVPTASSRANDSDIDERILFAVTQTKGSQIIV